MYLSEELTPIAPPDSILTPLQWFALVLASLAVFFGVAVLTYALRHHQRNKAATVGLGAAGMTAAVVVLLVMVGTPIPVVYVIGILIVTGLAALVVALLLTIEEP